MDNLTVVVPFWNGHESIGRLLARLPMDLPVLVVDDHSDQPPDISRSNVRIIRPERKGYFTGAVNAGLAATRTDVLVLNQDIELYGTAWLDLIATNRNRYAMIGDAVFGNPAWPNGYVQGTFMFMRRDAIRVVGEMNQRDFPLWGSTCEWQLRACRQGFRALPTSIPGMVHERQPGQSFGPAITKALENEPHKRGLFVRTPPLVSVVIPCHNYGRFLPDAVASLVGGKSCLGEMLPQTLQAFEIIIVDDASTDETEQVGQFLADPWQGIRYIRLQENMGTPDANNAGCVAAHGRFITILSADDMREPWSLEALYRVVERNPRAVAYDDLRTVTEGKRSTVWPMPEYDFVGLATKNQMHAGIMFSKAAWQEARGYPSVMRAGREDWAFNIALGIAGYCGEHVPSAGYLYRRDGQGRSETNSSRKDRTAFLAQLSRLFPQVYRGDWSMCGCGQKANVTPRMVASRNSYSSMIQRSTMKDLPSTRVTYLGTSLGMMPFYGKKTNTRYYFSTKKHTSRVYDPDVPGILAETAPGGGKLFKLADAPAVTPSVELEGAEAPADPFVAFMTGQAEVVPAATLDPSTMTVDDIKEALSDLSHSQLLALLEAEQGGKARHTALVVIQAALDKAPEGAES